METSMKRGARSEPRAHAGRVVAAFVLATVGCATSHVPQQSPRVVFTMDGGAVKLTRDGKSFGIFEADQAVAGNAEAEAEARTYRHRTTAGLIADFAGLGLIIGGSVVAHSGSSSTRNDVGAGLVVGGLASIAVALPLVFTGLPHLYDAVNIYNDALASGARSPGSP
jgi:hypothetical protein